MGQWIISFSLTLGICQWHAVMGHWTTDQKVTDNEKVENKRLVDP